jgi:hypothetical protein
MLPRELVEGTRSLSRLRLWPGVLLIAILVYWLAPAPAQSRDWGFELAPAQLP